MSAKKIRGTKPGATHATGPGGLSAADFALWYRERAQSCWAQLDLAAIARLGAELERCAREGRTVWVMGNGGSAATASHFATDFSKTAHVDGKPPVRAICLNDNVAYMTAIANDKSYDHVFADQLERLCEPNDLVILISGSGNSKNLLFAAECAKRRGAATAALLGFDGGALKDQADFHALVASDQYGVIEDLHMAVGHILTFWLKQRP